MDDDVLHPRPPPRHWRNVQKVIPRVSLFERRSYPPDERLLLIKRILIAMAVVPAVLVFDRRTNWVLALVFGLGLVTFQL